MVTESPSSVRSETTRPWVGTTPTNVTVPSIGRDDVLVRRAGDVDPSVLARGVGVGSERERAEHLPVQRPRPGTCRTCDPERGHERGCEAPNKATHLRHLLRSLRGQRGE